MDEPLCTTSLPASPLNRRISRVSRHMAKLVCQLRREGDDAGARKLEAAAIETVEAMRGGRL